MFLLLLFMVVLFAAGGTLGLFVLCALVRCADVQDEMREDSPASNQSPGW